MTTEKTIGVNNTLVKIIGLIGSVIATLALFVGAVMWISVSMADNKIRIEGIEKDHVKYENLIRENRQLLNQHSKLLVILEQHGNRLELLTNFMTQGGRFTADEGKEISDEIGKVKERLQHYAILETELSWIKKSMARIERDLALRFDSLQKKIEINIANNHKEK
jgi:hypothetical protein